MAETVPIRVTETDYEELKQIAEERNLSMSQAASEAFGFDRDRTENRYVTHAETKRMLRKLARFVELEADIDKGRIVNRLRYEWQETDELPEDMRL